LGFGGHLFGSLSAGHKVARKALRFARLFAKIRPTADDFSRSRKILQSFDSLSAPEDASRGRRPTARLPTAKHRISPAK